MTETLFEGLILSIISDEGPIPMINLSSFDETIAYKIGIVGVTIFSMGFVTIDDVKERNYKLLGPIPVPEHNEFSILAIFFNVIPDLGTSDNRIESFGRTCSLWLIFNIRNRYKILQNFDLIESVIINNILQFKKESDIKEEKFLNILTEIQSSNFINNVAQNIDYIESQFSSEMINFGYYTVNEKEQLVPVHDLTKIKSLDCLIQVNLNEKEIYIIKINPNVSQRKMFLTASLTSKLNIEKLKSEFSIKKINDEIESNFYLTKIDNLIKKK